MPGYGSIGGGGFFYGQAMAAPWPEREIGSTVYDSDGAALGTMQADGTIKRLTQLEAPACVPTKTTRAMKLKGDET